VLSQLATVEFSVEDTNFNKWFPPKSVNENG